MLAQSGGLAVRRAAGQRAQVECSQRFVVLRMRGENLREHIRTLGANLCIDLRVVHEDQRLADAALNLLGFCRGVVGERGLDLLLQVVLQARIGLEAGEFTLAEVIAGIRDKLIRRHPHVFGNTQVSGVGEVLENWEKLKAAERQAGAKPDKGALGTVPPALPALMQAATFQRRAAREEVLAGRGVDGIRETFRVSLQTWIENPGLFRLYAQEMQHPTSPMGKMARELRPEVVLIDLGLPDANGCDIARSLRASAESSSAKLVALTGYGDVAMRRLAHEAGFDDFVVKPFSAEGLAALLQS